MLPLGSIISRRDGCPKPQGSEEEHPKKPGRFCGPVVRRSPGRGHVALSTPVPALTPPPTPTPAEKLHGKRAVCGCSGAGYEENGREVDREGPFGRHMAVGFLGCPPLTPKNEERGARARFLEGAWEVVVIRLALLHLGSW